MFYTAKISPMEDPNIVKIGQNQRKAAEGVMPYNFLKSLMKCA